MAFTARSSGSGNGSSTASRRDMLLLCACLALVGAVQYYNRLFHVLLAPDGAGGSAAVVASLLEQPMPCKDTDSKTSSRTESVAGRIIRQSFDATYAKLTAINCPKTLRAGACYQTLLRRNHTAGTGEPSLPWWFRTMLQQSTIIASQWWMLLKSNYPPLRQCQLPKVGSKQWSVFMHMMNADPNPNHPDGKNKTNAWNERGKNDAGPKFVVLRDPLERYLSAFLDKCVKDINDKNAGQKHCEPWDVFRPDFGNIAIREINGDDRVMFEAFVHASPLKWNMHFLPQALLCDGLYRTIHEYDYVARMGPDFYSDLQNMGHLFGAKADDAMQEIFDYKTKLKEEDDSKKGDVRYSNEVLLRLGSVQASEKVEKFYTPALVRKVLEYTAIDYVLLNMTVPSWAEKMLRQEK